LRALTAQSRRLKSADKSRSAEWQEWVVRRLAAFGWTVFIADVSVFFLDPENEGVFAVKAYEATIKRCGSERIPTL